MIEQAINPAEKQINKSAKYFIEWTPVFFFCVGGVLLGLGLVLIPSARQCNAASLQFLGAI